MKKLILLLLAAFTLSIFVPEVQAAKPTVTKAQAKAAKKKRARKHHKKKHRKHRKNKKKVAFSPTPAIGQAA